MVPHRTSFSRLTTMSLTLFGPKDWRASISLHNDRAAAWVISSPKTPGFSTMQRALHLQKNNSEKKNEKKRSCLRANQQRVHTPNESNMEGRRTLCLNSISYDWLLWSIGLSESTSTSSPSTGTRRESRSNHSHASTRWCSGNEVCPHMISKLQHTRKVILIIIAGRINSLTFSSFFHNQFCHIFQIQTWAVMNVNHTSAISCSACLTFTKSISWKSRISWDGANCNNLFNICNNIKSS